MKYKGAALMIAILVIIAVVYFYTKARKRVKYLNKPVPVDFILYDANGQPTTVSLTQEQVDEVKFIAAGLYIDMDGVSNLLTGRDAVPYERLASASDTIFVAVYNYFNTMVADEGEGTLRTWIEDENYSWTDNAWNQDTYTLVENTILPRMERLQLT